MTNATNKTASKFKTRLVPKRMLQDILKELRTVPSITVERLQDRGYRATDNKDGLILEALIGSHDYLTRFNTEWLNLDS